MNDLIVPLMIIHTTFAHVLKLVDRAARRNVVANVHDAGCWLTFCNALIGESQHGFLVMRQQDSLTVSCQLQKFRILHFRNFVLSAYNIYKGATIFEAM